MKTFVHVVVGTAVFCSAMLTVLESTAHASSPELSALAPTVHHRDRQVEFSVTCDEHGTPESTSPGWQTLVRYVNPYRKHRHCRIVGDQDSAVFICRCVEHETKSAGTAVVGELYGADLFPSGVPVATEDPAPTQQIQVRLSDVCGRLFDEHCGDSPRELQVNCSTEHGRCGVEAQRLTDLPDSDGAGFQGLQVGCRCDSGQAWTSVEYGSDEQPFAFDGAQAQELCEAESAHCAPDAEPGPTQLEITEPGRESERGVTCVRNFEHSEYDASVCFVDQRGIHIRHRCVHGLTSRQGEVRSEAWLSRAELHDQCLQFLDELAPPAPKPKPKPPGQEGDPDCVDIEDIAKLFGCALGGNAPLSSWGGFLLLVAAVRKKRGLGCS